MPLQSKRDSEFDARWATWLARGAVHYRAVRGRLVILVPAAFVAPVVVYVMFSESGRNHRERTVHLTYMTLRGNLWVLLRTRIFVQSMATGPFRLYFIGSHCDPKPGTIPETPSPSCRVVSY
jgi:hypothetical protein